MRVGAQTSLPSTDTVWVGALQGSHDGPISQMDKERPGQGRAEVEGPRQRVGSGAQGPGPGPPGHDFLSSLHEVMGPSPHQAQPRGSVWVISGVAFFL